MSLRKNSRDTPGYPLLAVDWKCPPKNFFALWQPVRLMCSAKNINLKIEIVRHKQQSF